MAGKLKLELEHLAVESFDTQASAERKGTVFGEQCTCWTNCTCPGCPTCAASCNGTCGGTCDASACYGSCNCSGYYSCDGCTMEAMATCFNYGTCDPARVCQEVP